MRNSSRVYGKFIEDAGSMNKTVAAMIYTAMLWLFSGQALADPYLGYFAGELDGRQYQVNIDPVNATTYDGILQIDGEPMQLDARRYGENLRGLLRSHTEQLGFRARVQGSILIVDTEDGRRIVLRRKAPE
jgi:hypothetical protein